MVASEHLSQGAFSAIGTNQDKSYSKNKNAADESDRYDGTTVGSKKIDGGNPAPVGETSESGIYTKKNANPGFEG